MSSFDALFFGLKRLYEGWAPSRSLIVTCMEFFFHPYKLVGTHLVGHPGWFHTRFLLHPKNKNIAHVLTILRKNNLRRSSRLLICPVKLENHICSAIFLVGRTNKYNKPMVGRTYRNNMGVTSCHSVSQRCNKTTRGPS